MGLQNYHLLIIKGNLTIITQMECKVLFFPVWHKKFNNTHLWTTSKIVPFHHIYWNLFAQMTEKERLIMWLKHNHPIIVQHQSHCANFPFNFTSSAFFCFALMQLWPSCQGNRYVLCTYLNPYTCQPFGENSSKILPSRLLSVSLALSDSFKLFQNIFF